MNWAGLVRLSRSVAQEDTVRLVTRLPALATVAITGLALTTTAAAPAVARQVTAASARRRRFADIRVTRSRLATSDSGRAGT